MKETVTTTMLTKEYGGTECVSHLNMNVREGRIYGFLGPNGLRYKLKKLSSTSLR